MLKYGTDPEFFASVNLDGKDFVISPALLETEGLINPVKDDNKHPVYINNKDFSWIMDGVAFEATYHKPFKNAKELYQTVNNSLENLTEYLCNISYRGLPINLCKKPVINIEPLDYLPLIKNNSKIYQGFIFGCDPDEDAILTDYKCETLDVEKHLFRYGGGHFHISGEDFLYEYPHPAIKLLAITVGNFVISESIFKEEEKQRALTYGKPGRFRKQQYKDSKGIEYRTPSNSWLSFNLEKMDELINYANKSVELLKNPEEGKDIINQFLQPTINSIINCDTETSREILSFI